MELYNQIEALLFWRGEPMAFADICRVFKLPSADIKKELKILAEKLEGSGITLIQTGEDIALGTASGAHELIERVRKEELGGDLSKAALETLSVILYKGPVSRSEIEYVRGVNSTAILRSLLIRGLVERKQSEVDERQFLYRASVELYALLGIGKSEDLPEFATVRKELDAAATVVAEEELPSGEMGGRKVAEEDTSYA